MYEGEEILKFKAVITYERYYNSDSTWGTYGFYTYDDIPYFTKETARDALFETEDETDKEKKFSSIVGKMQELTIGGEYLVKAKYKYDKKYGHQYEPISVYALIPQTKESQLMFLQSLISPNIAENLINVYPNVVNDVVNGTLKEIDYSLVKGVREFTWNRIKEKIINNFLISDIITMLKPLGVTYTMIKKLLSDEPNPELLKLKLEENPYILCKIPQLGFKRVDDLALKLKPELLNSTERLVAFIKYFFIEMGESEGHTWCSGNILKTVISNIVPECVDKLEWLLNNNEFLYISNHRIGLKYYHDIERRIYDILVEKSKKETNINISDEKIDLAIQHAEEEQGFQYVAEQLDAIKSSLKRTVSIITGKAGTGKSTLMRAIIKAYQENHYSLCASALSAMAAQRITEATGFPAMTIHRTLGCVGVNQFTFNKDSPMIVNVAYMDEGSMVNAQLFLSWLEAVGDNTRIIISGDHKQLPPIGFGNVFSDLIEMLDGTIVSKLVKPMRQAEKSGILVDANLIRDNINPITEKLQPKILHGELKDMYYMFRTNRQSLFDIAVKTFLKSVETDGLDNVVIAVPRRKDCLNSAGSLNETIQEKLLGNEEKSISGFDITFKLGAKVMQTVNDYDKNVFNGEIGYITEIDERYNGKKKEEYCVVTYTDTAGKEKHIEYKKKELGVLDLAYAMTVHKCITDDTWLFTSDGIKQLKYFNNNAKELSSKSLDTDIEVYNGNYLEKPCNFYNAGISKCKKITTKRGYSLIATEDHKLDVLYPDGIIRPKYVRDISEDDYVIVQRGSNIYGNKIELPKTLYVNENELDIRTNILKYPRYLTNEFARFLGYMVADGVISSSGLKYGKNHKNVVVDFENIVYQIFGYKTCHEPKNVLPNGKMGGMYLSEINSKYIKNYCKKIDGIQPYNKHVPQIILDAPRQYQIEFLRGVFEDGSVCIKNNKFDHISFTAKEEFLINQIQMMLLNMGIITTKYYRNREGIESFTLFLYGVNCDRFIKEIGFISNEKMEKAFKYYEKTNNCETYSIPYITKIISEIISKYKISKIDNDIYKALKKERITYTTLGKFLSYCKEHNIYDNMVNYLFDIFKNTDIQKVNSTEEREEHTYCIEMPITHKFVQNGIRGWNCQGSGYQTVICIIDNTHYKLLDNCMLYTMLTRAKKRCLLLAEPQAFQQCIRTSHNKRNTWMMLEEKIA